MSDREELVKKAVHSLMHTNIKHRKIMRTHLDSTGVFESQHRLLMTISRHRDYSQKQLADKMNVSTATIAVTIKKLEKDGFIEKIMDPDDNRFNKIGITELGQKVVDDSKNIFKEIESCMFEGFSDEDIDQLTTYLEKINQNLDKCQEVGWEAK